MRERLTLYLLVLLAFSSCGCQQADQVLYHIFVERDSKAPTLLSWSMNDPKTAELIFSEPLANRGASVECAERRITAVSVQQNRLICSFDRPLALGTTVSLAVRVEDLVGNSRSLSVTLWAQNPQPAALLINEFTTKGTEANPDRVELLVAGRGNLAGLTLYVGTPTLSDDSYTFGDRWVERGEYLVVCFQEGDQEGCYDSYSLSGLSANNGALTLTLTPEWESPILDAVVWGNMSTTTYDGFGSERLQAQVAELYRAGHWSGQRSSDSINSTYSTATRSFCRYKAVDTNSSDDWYICDTRKSSFGKPNSEQVYTP